MTKPYLALFRAGPGSLHPHAVERLDQQNFDYALSWFGDDPPQAPDAAFVHMQKGAKWPGLEQTLRTYWDAIQQYRFVWLPDDDLLCVPEQVSRMFAICDELQLDLAQPALTPDSYYTHVITLQHSAFQMRFTSFVEIMAPVLSIDMLARIHPTLAGNISGYGLDAVWPHYTKLGKVAIIDDTPVRHTRPVGGPNYAFSRKAGLAPAHEDWLTSAMYGVERPADFQINYAGLLQSGDPIVIGGTAGELDTMLRHLIASCNGRKISALQLTRYLSNHFDFGSGGSSGSARYPRALVRIALNHALGHVRIRFPAPPEPGQDEAGAPSSATAASETS